MLGHGNPSSCEQHHAIESQATHLETSPQKSSKCDDAKSARDAKGQTGDQVQLLNLQIELEKAKTEFATAESWLLEAVPEERHAKSRCDPSL